MTKKNKETLTIGEYVFTLKKFHYFEKLSEETICFVAELHVNGTLLARCKNEGHGGATFVLIEPGARNFGERIEKYLRNQPKVKFDGCDFEKECNLVYVVDTLVDKEMEARDLARLRKMFPVKLVFKDKRGHYTISWKNCNVEKMLGDVVSRVMLRDVIRREQSKGAVLLNENIPDEFKK